MAGPGPKKSQNSWPAWSNFLCIPNLIRKPSNLAPSFLSTWVYISFSGLSWVLCSHFCKTHNNSKCNFSLGSSIVLWSISFPYQWTFMILSVCKFKMISIVISLISKIIYLITFMRFCSGFKIPCLRTHW